jgi:anti-sigma regulatory factor (Ser/Thr protein kinase)
MGNNLSWSQERSLQAIPTSASEARAFVSHCLVEHRLPYLVDSIRLVASELATNALVHAQTAFTVTLSELEETVLLTVRDESTTSPLRATPQVMDTGGRGLQIVESVSLDWGFCTDHEAAKTVWASFAKRGERTL